MNMTFTVAADGTTSFESKNEQGEIIRSIPKILNTSETIRILKKSRRHLYRLIGRGLLQPVAKFSGELFFDQADIDRLGSARKKRWGALPSSFSPFFPEYDIRTLHLDRDAHIILSRLLERGSRKEIIWARRQYPPVRWKKFLKQDGFRLLSPRTARYWSWLFGVKGETKTQGWRVQGRTWGGVS